MKKRAGRKRKERSRVGTFSRQTDNRQNKTKGLFEVAKEGKKGQARALSVHNQEWVSSRSIVVGCTPGLVR